MATCTSRTSSHVRWFVVPLAILHHKWHLRSEPCPNMLHVKHNKWSVVMVITQNVKCKIRSKEVNLYRYRLKYLVIHLYTVYLIHMRQSCLPRIHMLIVAVQLILYRYAIYHNLTFTLQIVFDRRWVEQVWWRWCVRSLAIQCTPATCKHFS